MENGYVANKFSQMFNNILNQLPLYTANISFESGSCALWYRRIRFYSVAITSISKEFLACVPHKKNSYLAIESVVVRFVLYVPNRNRDKVRTLYVNYSKPFDLN